MTNILDYLKWRGDLSFQQDPFNAIDSLILSRAAYIRWELVFKNADEVLTLKKAYERFISQDLSKVHMLMKEDPELFERMATGRRFSQIYVSNFVNEVNDEMQFSAIVFHLDDKTNYVAFRGTDNTLVGWKEDMTMSFKDSVKSQRRSVHYLRTVSNIKGKLRIGGHSKGGNLAIYASLFVGQKIQKRILSIDNFDGPGLSQAVLDKKKNHPLFERVHLYVPQKSMIGRFLYLDNVEQSVIESSAKGIYQHDLYSWHVEGNHFVLSSSFDKGSDLLDDVLKDFLKQADDSLREESVELIFEVLQSGNTETFHDLSSNLLKKTPTLLKAISNVDPEKRKSIIASFKILMQLFINQMQEDD